MLLEISLRGNPESGSLVSDTFSEEFKHLPCNYPRLPISYGRISLCRLDMKWRQHFLNLAKAGEPSCGISDKKLNILTQK